MSKGWRIIGTFVLILILLGAICIGVGFMTGGNMSDIYNVLDVRYNLSGRWDAWSQWTVVTFHNLVEALQQLL